MKEKIVQAALAMALFAVSFPLAAVTNLDVSPGSVSSDIRLDVPRVSVDATGGSGRLRFRELFDGRPLRVSFSPGSFSASWSVTCGNPNATSPRGEFRANGSVLATSNATLTSAACGTTESVTESVTLPDALGSAIADRVLDQRMPFPPAELTERRLRDALEAAARDVAADLVYERRWQAAAVRTDRINVSLGARVVGGIQLDFSRLVAFEGSTSTGSVSFLGAARPVPVTWTGVVEQVGQGSNLTLTSDRFVIRSRSGAVVGQGTRRLTRSGIRSGRANFNETIRLSSSQVLRARQAGGGLVLERTLSDNVGNSITARIPLNLTGPSQAEFAVSAMQCRFHDGARVKIVNEGDQVHVVCDLRFDGPGGLLRGTWEEAEGGGGQLFFRPLQIYSNFVVGQNRVQVSRTFTARGTGRHVVRFRVQEPDLLVDQTAIQYYVGVDPEQVSTAALPAPLSVLNPAPNSVAAEGLEVSWSDLPEAATHVLIEFFTPDQLLEEPSANEREQRSSSLLVRGEPAAGMVVPADRDRARVSLLTREHLEGAGRLYMRVSALEEGVTVGVSPLRRLNAP
ncbi:MAG: hypothetical protein U5R46_18915 [Gammaproteobacteria bacterium]|nr:hypothetical protein [Gammaproteobacteria bacterium]